MRHDNDNVPLEKRCSCCKAVKPLDKFHKQPSGKFGRHSYCAECANKKRADNRPTTSSERGYTFEQKREWNLKKRYGLTAEDYDKIFASQNFVCAICCEAPERPCVDHDHQTGAVRGILCHRCNIGLPYVENESYRAKAINYLERCEDLAA